MMRATRVDQRASVNDARAGAATRGPVASKGCAYRTTPGTATVISLESMIDSETIDASYRATADVTFTFPPADSPAGDEAPK